MLNLEQLKNLLETQLPWQLEDQPSHQLALKSINGVVFAWRTNCERITFKLNQLVKVHIHCTTNPALSRAKSFDPESLTLAQEIAGFISVPRLV